MNQHLSSEEITHCLAGMRTPVMEQHLRECAQCAAEIDRVAGQLALFRTAVRSWGEREMPDQPFVLLPERPWRELSPLHWRLVLAGAAALAIAVPVLRHAQPPPRPNPAVVRQTQISDAALLQQVETELSRSVPATMEPLANLMPSGFNTKETSE